jgi:hypothetical protein
MKNYDEFQRFDYRIASKRAPTLTANIGAAFPTRISFLSNPVLYLSYSDLESWRSAPLRPFSMS